MLGDPAQAFKLTQQVLHSDQPPQPRKTDFHAHLPIVCCFGVPDFVIPLRPSWFLCRYDFYLVNQIANRGTVSPTHYNVIYDDNALKPDHMQRLTFKLCHLYYNWQVRNSCSLKVPSWDLPCPSVPLTSQRGMSTRYFKSVRGTYSVTEIKQREACPQAQVQSPQDLVILITSGETEDSTGLSVAYA